MRKLLLHSCCAPCSTHVIDVLKSQYDLTLFYYNPNIFPKEEYEKRLAEQKRYAEFLGVKLLTKDYDEQEFLSKVKGLELEKEGGKRCNVCFEIRLRETAKVCKENGFDIFATTLSVSPHKNSNIINNIGRGIAEEYGVDFLEESFKKKEGYLHSIQLSKEFGLYRQNYCGCRFSLRRDNEREV
jgi:predicted adenine nucleotide alpha hydrolase (AANH) superfamily ATPase